jgi:hypothetical protein
MLPVASLILSSQEIDFNVYDMVICLDLSMEDEKLLPLLVASGQNQLGD